MKLPASIEKGAAKFNAMSLRERVLVVAATAAAVIMTWTIAIQDPIQAKERALNLEQSSIQDSLLAASLETDGSSIEHPATVALTKETELKARLAEINAKLESESAGLIPPERMVEVIHDVLTRQRGVKLISLHNKAVTTLAQRTERDSANQDIASPESSGPYMHPVEIVVEGKYLDILSYLRALEELPWHFYWKDLELTSIEYPLNRVRIELGTLSMDKEWIGV